MSAIVNSIVDSVYLLPMNFLPGALMALIDVLWQTFGINTGNPYLNTLLMQIPMVAKLIIWDKTRMSMTPATS